MEFISVALLNFDAAYFLTVLMIMAICMPDR